MLIVTLTLIAAVAALVYQFLIWNFDYWKKRGVKSPKPLPFLGNYPHTISQKKHMVYDLDELYRANKRDEDFVGIFRCRSPQLLVLNPELVKRVYVSDFKHFHDNEASQFIDEKSDFIFANNPFGLIGEKWKERRAEITPGLTASRIKTVFSITEKICQKMTEYVKIQNRAAPKDGISGKDLSLCFTTEVVSDAVLGINADSFSDKPTPVKRVVSELFGQNLRIIFYLIAIGLFPGIQKFYKSRFVPKKAETFFVDLMQTAIDLRKSQKQDRVDFLNYLLQLQEKKNLSTLDLTAHSMTFLLDGFETTADVLSSCLLLLARDPVVQDKLRNEIESNLDENGKINFDKLSELPYLDACIHETIRIFPPGIFSIKLCTEPIEITNKNGKTLKLAKDETVVLPLYSIMMDEEYYPEPQSFKPERFLESEGESVKKYRESGLYYGFGDGPRICLGMRFALTQIKAAVVELLRNFNIRVNPKTRKDNVFDPKYFLTQLEGGVWLDFESR